MPPTAGFDSVSDIGQRRLLCGPWPTGFIMLCARCVTNRTELGQHAEAVGFGRRMMVRLRIPSIRAMYGVLMNTMRPRMCPADGNTLVCSFTTQLSCKGVVRALPADGSRLNVRYDVSSAHLALPCLLHSPSWCKPCMRRSSRGPSRETCSATPDSSRSDPITQINTSPLFPLFLSTRFHH